MKKYSLLFVVLLCYVVTEVNAQSKDTTSQKKVIQEITSQKVVWTYSVLFLNKGEKMKISESVIQKGTSLTVEVAWNPELVEKIVFDTLVYKITPQDIKNCKYTFVIKPEKTTTYNYKFYNRNGRERLASRKITVTDKNGVEIKEEELKSDQQKKK